MPVSEVFFEISKLSKRLSSISGITGSGSSFAGSKVIKSDEDVLTGGWVSGTESDDDVLMGGWVRVTESADEVLVGGWITGLSSIEFSYEVFNNNGEKTTEGKTLLAFLNSDSMKPIRCPDMISKLF